MVKHLVGIAILLDRYAFNVARGLEVSLSTKFNTLGGLNQSPHITIKRPFVVDDNGLKKIEDYLERLSHSVQPFPVHITGIGYFDPTVVFLDVEHSRELVSLHRQIVEELSSEFSIPPDAIEERQAMKFHSTLAYGDLTPDMFINIRKHLQDFALDYTFPVGELALFYNVEPKNYWIVYRKCMVNSSLGKKMVASMA